ncbi:MAG: HlyC/CorC family transporter [Bacteroidetes bacterium]|jgi:putative hemolysin|nr:HlyC/CorC family transporter [Bacteroidota bacterium]
MIEIIILICLIFLNGIFVMAEISLVSARKTKLESMAEKGDSRAKAALKLAENPELFLSTVQLGITVFSILIGFYSGEKFSHYLTPHLSQIDFLKPYASNISTVFIETIVTFLLIIFGELLPKRTGIFRAEQIARIVARPMQLLSKATYPIIWLLNTTSNLFFKILDIKPSRDSNVTEEEIKAMISEGTEQGEIEETEQEIIERVFHLGDRNITSLMTHRSDIVWFDIHENETLIKEKILKETHSFYPVCDGDIDDVKGVVSIKDLYINDDNRPFKDFAAKPMFVPENNSAYQVLEKFRQTKIHCCFIVDEYGSLLGIITLTDILEAIIGDLPQPHTNDYEITERGDGSYLVDGQIPFYDFLTHFDKADWMNEGDQEFDTLAGFILHQLERIPHTGETLEWKDFKFEIIDMDAQRIDKVLVNFINPEESNIDGDA